MSRRDSSLLSGCRAVEVKSSFVQGSGLFASTLDPFKTSSIARAGSGDAGARGVSCVIVAAGLVLARGSLPAFPRPCRTACANSMIANAIHCSCAVPCVPARGRARGAAAFKNLFPAEPGAARVFRCADDISRQMKWAHRDISRSKHALRANFICIEVLWS